MLAGARIQNSFVRKRATDIVLSASAKKVPAKGLTRGLQGWIAASRTWVVSHFTNLMHELG
jgi:hypothetical protein